jgi:two-component system, NtrC family, nitrogen regulation sensor histidine kinase NtrY
MGGDITSMTFRRKLLTVFALTVFLSVAGVAVLVQWLTRDAFEKTENERTAALVAQFQKEFNRRGEEVARRVQGIASSDTVTRMSTTLNGSTADSSEYFDLARTLAESHQLDFLELLDSRGAIISSAQSPAKFGYADSSFDAGSSNQGPFLKVEELQDGPVLGFFAARAVEGGDHPVFVVGGRKMDKDFLSALDLPPGMRVLLYQNRGNHFSADLLMSPASTSSADGAHPADKVAPLIEAVSKYNQEISGVVKWTSDQADDELFHAIPLRGDGKDHPLLAVLLVGNSRRSYVELKRRILDSALLVGGGGIVLAILLSSWAAARVTRPIEQLATAAQEVTAGDWTARVEVPPGRDEVAQLAESFNQMTTELLGQKERLMQAERVAAWRELARRLAHELKNPLFPLQLTVENLLRARELSPREFDEIFNESSRTLLAEISNLKGITGRFSEFSKMPQPEWQRVQVNNAVTAVSQLFQAQLQAPGRAAISCRMELDERAGTIAADPELLHRALSNLVLNAMDAMPNGGSIILRTRRADSKVMIEVADTGSGLTPEECERIFTPYYTSKQHGTGLGLAIVQSVVSDHAGRISVRSEPSKGTTFVIELPDNLQALQKPTASATTLTV